MTFELIEQLDFITIAQENGELSIQSDDLEDEGTYEINLRAFIVVPDNFSNTASSIL